MSSAYGTIRKINSTIEALDKIEFTLEELSSILKKRYPYWAPSDRTLKRYLGWPQINAELSNEKYRRINSK